VKNSIFKYPSRPCQSPNRQCPMEVLDIKSVFLAEDQTLPLSDEMAKDYPCALCSQILVVALR